MTKEIEGLKEVLMHAIEQQKVYPESKTLPKAIKYLKKWMVKLHREQMKSAIPIEVIDSV